MVFHLIHRTNYRGLYIHATDTDDEVPFDVIWTQPVWRDNGKGCCQGFGDRVVRIENDDFKPGRMWFLYLVSDRTAYTTHRFLKFVLSKMDDLEGDWDNMGAFTSDQIMSELRNEFIDILRHDDNSEFFWHFHIGLHTDIIMTDLDTLEAEVAYWDEVAREAEENDAIEAALWEEWAEDAAREAEENDAIEAALWDEWAEDAAREAEINKAIEAKEEAAYWDELAEDAARDAEIDKAIEAKEEAAWLRELLK